MTRGRLRMTKGGAQDDNRGARWDDKGETCCAARGEKAYWDRGPAKNGAARKKAAPF